MRISDWSSDVCSSDLDRDTRRAAAEEARARLSQAIADRDLARINLERAEVRSPVNGIVTNFQLRRGIYANAGQPVMTLVDSDSFYVSGYFEETKLGHIHEGQDRKSTRLNSSH